MSDTSIYSVVIVIFAILVLSSTGFEYYSMRKNTVCEDTTFKATTEQDDNNRDIQPTDIKTIDEEYKSISFDPAAGDSSLCNKQVGMDTKGSTSNLMPQSNDEIVEKRKRGNLNVVQHHLCAKDAVKS